MREVEVLGEVSEYPNALAHSRARVGAAVVRRIEASTIEEVVFDELRVRVEAQDLVVDVAAPGVRTDDEARNA